MNNQMQPIVIKVGGSEGIDLDSLCDDVASLVREGVPLVLVHGGSAKTNQVAEQLGHPAQFVTSPSGFTSRLTDRTALEIFEMVYCGSVNKGIVERLQTRGVNAIGLSGLDGRIWEGKRKKNIRVVQDGKVRVLRDSWTGTVERVNVDLLRSMMSAGYLPVLTPPGCSVDGEAINVDGDRAAARTAQALGADTLLLLSNVPGLLREFPDEGSLINEIPLPELDAAMEFAEGRMRIKLLGAREALEGGVDRVVLGDARGEEPVRRALEGTGTVLFGGK
ncbi:MAG: acetylglutamate/LysW-gamma-L-alpha-aminoadipate kinase [Candidatus Paceibacteria bacterium]|jgi:acetylglutamate/LysW-gamma-L-alpha-aminoadipate kinase